MAAITHRITKDAGGFNIETFVDGQSARLTWTAGSKKDANEVAHGHRLALEGLCGCHFSPCTFVKYGQPCPNAPKKEDK